MSVSIRRLTSSDVPLLRALLTTFGKVFNQPDIYIANQPGEVYLRQLLGDATFIALVALKGEETVGGLTAYELRKYEQERSEVYIYDLCVASGHRREGIATSLIEALKRIAAERGAWVVIVQADTGIEDQPAIALYSKLGKREQVLHFDIAVETGPGTEKR